jgi:hypothetical protein
MVSRIVLALQYLLVMWHVRRYENAKLPFILIAGANFIAAAIYLGVTLLVTGAVSSCNLLTCLQYFQISRQPGIQEFLRNCHF